MSGSKETAKIDEFDLELMECSRQPGRLRLSKRACGLQYRLAQRKYHRIPNDEFGMVRRMSLEICRTCPEGRLCSESLKEKPAKQKRDFRFGSHKKVRTFPGRRKRRSDVTSFREQ